MAPFADGLAHGGVFLSVGGGAPNTMTIGWAQIGWMWRGPYLIAMVRPSRHTYGILENEGAFTVSVPAPGTLRKELAFAGSASGRDVDKFKGHGLTAVPGQKIDAPVVGECPLHIECVVRHKQDLTTEFMTPQIEAVGYPHGDLHRLYFGEIVACYRTEE